MANLKFVLRRISATKLAEFLGIQKCNISIWKKANKIPKKHLAKIKEIKNELANKSI
jgi:DNA-binding Xre family transcriptional regulator